MEYRVGVIIPSYNQELFLNRAISTAIENKKFSASKNLTVRIAVIDGGSTDGSVEIIKKNSEEIDYWISQKDGGQSEAINKGIDALKNCDFYMWLNSDDEYDSKKSIYEIVKYAIAEKKEVVYGFSHLIDENGRIIKDYPVDNKYDGRKFQHRCFFSQPSVLFSKSAYEKVGKINEHLQMCMDYEYWIRLSKYFDMSCCDKYIGNTRIYGQTKTAKNQKRHLQEAILILDHYFGKVNTEWLLAWVLETNKNRFLHLVPKHLMKFILYFQKKHIVNSVKREMNENEFFSTQNM